MIPCDYQERAIITRQNVHTPILQSGVLDPEGQLKSRGSVCHCRHLGVLHVKPELAWNLDHNQREGLPLPQCM